MIDANISLWVILAMLALPVGVGALLICFIAMDIADLRKTKEQIEYLKELYKKCIEMHGLKFAQKLYDGCREPLWIGLENTIMVFEHHCGINSNKSKS